MRKVNRKGGASSKDKGVLRIPHDSVNETVLIAAVIVDEGARKRYLNTIPADVMFGKGHSKIWRALQVMDEKGLSYDPATLRQIGGDSIDVAYVEEIIEQRPVVPPNLKYHVEMLHWDAARVQTADGAVARFLDLLRDPKSDRLSVITAAKHIHIGLSEGGGSSLRNAQQLVESQITEMQSRRDGHATFPFGIERLDYHGPGEFRLDTNGERVDLEGQPRLIPGLAPGKMTVVTGVSGSGKSTVVAHAVRAAAKSGRRVAYGAYEVGSGISLELLATLELGFSRSAAMTGRLSQEDIQAFRKSMELFSFAVQFDEIPFSKFATRHAYPNDRALDRIAQTIVDSKCDIYVADLFKRTLVETDPADEERAVYQMQQLASSLNVHMVLVQQQNLKQVEATRHKMPQRDTTKGSGAWVEAADTMIGVHRPALWKELDDDTLCALILKQRYGMWPQKIDLNWNPTYGSIWGGKAVPVRFSGDGDEDGDSIGGFLSSKKRGRSAKVSKG